MVNFKKKLSEIILITTTVLVGGGYVYYSLLTEARDSFNNHSVVVYNSMPVVGSNALGNISTKSQHKASPGQQQNFITPGVSGTQLSSAAERPAIASHASGTLSGSAGTSYSYRATTGDKASSSTGGYGVGGMLTPGSRSGRSSDNGLSTQSAGRVILSEPGATSPFAVPLTPTTTPPTNGNGTILVDPMPDSTMNKIPVGDGIWMLLILALGYVGIRPLKLPSR